MERATQATEWAPPAGALPRVSPRESEGMDLPREAPEHPVFPGFPVWWRQQQTEAPVLSRQTYALRSNTLPLRREVSQPQRCTNSIREFSRKARLHRT